MAAQGPLTITECYTRLRIQTPKFEDAVNFYKRVFAAEEVERLHKPDSKLPYTFNVKINIGSDTFFVVASDYVDNDSDASRVFERQVTFIVHVPELDAVMGNASREEDVVRGDIQVVGDKRLFEMTDPFGFSWVIGAAAENRD